MLIPNSFGPRGVQTVCAPSNQPLVTSEDRSGDVISAAVWLRTQPTIDGARIGVLGNSHGGGTAVWVTQRKYEKAYLGLLKAAVDYYGLSIPTVTWHGAIAGPGRRRRRLGQPGAELPDPGGYLQSNQPFELHTYPGVVHSFDNSSLRGRITVEGHALEYDRAAAEDSFVQAKLFLDRYVGHPRG